MDPSTIASTAIQLLIPYLKKLVEGAAKTTGEEMGNSAWEKAQRLYNLTAKRFSSTKTQKQLEELKCNPDDPALRQNVEMSLRQLIENDESFAAQIADLLLDNPASGDAPSSTTFNNTFYGNVDNITQIGSIRSRR